MPVEVKQSQPVDGALLFTTIAAISYFFFLFLLIFTAVTLDGHCLYTFWLKYTHVPFSPYWLTVVTVSILCLWAFGAFLHALLRRPLQIGRIIYFAVAFVIVGGWLYDLHGFWNAMQYERNELSAEQFFGVHTSALRVTPHQCTGI